MARILLIESDRLLAANLMTALRGKGHRLEWQVEPQAAIHSTDLAQPDLVVLNLILASHSGVEFLYEFRSYPEWQSVPVVVLGEMSREELEVADEILQQLGVTAFHHKPFTSLQQITASVEQVLSSLPVAV